MAGEDAVAAEDKVPQEPSVELRRAAPDLTVTSTEVGPAASGPGSPPGARHRAQRWRHAIDLHGWVLPPVRRWPRLATRKVVAWSRRPVGRLVLPALLILALVGATGAAGFYLVPAAARPNQPVAAPPPTTEPTRVLLPAVPPTFSPPPTTGPLTGRPADALAGWAQQMSTRTQIPATAVQAYGYAEWVLSRQQPNCRLSWPTLAAIGKVESNHGRASSATLTIDGRAFPPIYGAALDGQGGRELVRDTDAGSLDKDTAYDRAVGPMQFIPQTWQIYQVDADDDGIRDPHDVDDASLAAANYLCAGGRNLSVADAWLQAILSYNNLRPYVDAVFAAANEYGQRSRATP